MHQASKLYIVLICERILIECDYPIRAYHDKHMLLHPPSDSGRTKTRK